MTHHSVKSVCSIVQTGFRCFFIVQSESRSQSLPPLRTGPIPQRRSPPRSGCCKIAFDQGSPKSQPIWILLGTLLFALLPAVGATTYWVAPAPAGADTNPGTRDHPWATPVKAMTGVTAGDTVVFRGGQYRLTQRLEPTVSGTAEAWIVWMGYPGEKPVFDGTDYIPPSGQHDNGLINMKNPGYWRLQNLHMTNSHGMGITVRGPSHHIDIVECSADNTFAPGIGLWNCSHVKVLFCEVTRSNNNALRLYGDASKEAPHEGISSGGARYFEIAWNHVHHGFKEGIDIKEVSAHGVVHHNYVHDMPRQGLYTDAWFGVL